MPSPSTEEPEHAKFIMVSDMLHYYVFMLDNDSLGVQLYRNCYPYKLDNSLVPMQVQNKSKDKCTSVTRHHAKI
jgi:hypothetical protein